MLEQLELQPSDLEADARTSRDRSADGSGAARSGAPILRCAASRGVRRSIHRSQMLSSQCAGKMSVARSGPNDTVAWSSRDTGGLDRAWRLG